ncbi:TNT domain-containing protein [Micromonospora sp. NPDC000207]|uniref:TNT domain-containing protein n=1 Tax=Micromonospora sp. NPDC000207 TaxID=3154246 RepID=UPI00331C51B4
MTVSRWALTVLSGAALVMVPAATSVADHTEAARTADRADVAPAAADRAEAPRSAAVERVAALRTAVLDRAGTPRDAPHATGAPQPDPTPSPRTDLCRPGRPPTAPETTRHHDGNYLFGPARLPTASPVGQLLTGYQRFGGVTEDQWAADYTLNDRTSLRYPPSSGFVLGPDGRPVKARQTLLVGYRLDRFGNPGGSFLSPLGTPYGSRALPPLNLNTPEKSPLANYHVYCVTKPFPVDAGPAAGWFAQPGLGTQFQLNPAYLPQAGAVLNVTWLLANGYLVEEDLTPRTATRCASTATAASAKRPTC